MGNPFVHVELSTTDVSKAKTFYSQLFDWKMEDMKMPGGDYTMLGVGDGTGGGLTLQSMPGAPSMWMAYVLVEDIGKAVTKVRALGGTVMQDATEIPGMGWFAVIVDPTGAVLGLWQSKA